MQAVSTHPAERPKNEKKGGPQEKNRVRLEVDFSFLETRCLRWCAGRVGGVHGRARRRVGGRGGRVGGGGLLSASVPVLSLPPRKLEDKWRRRLSPSLLPSPAGRGSAPGWEGAGRTPAIGHSRTWGAWRGRPPAVENSCFSPGAATHWAAWLGLWSQSRGRAGDGWRRPCSASPALTHQSSRTPARTQAGRRVRGLRRRRELRSFSK